MHVAASNPAYIDIAAVPTETLDKERAILIEQTKAEKKPPEIIAERWWKAGCANTLRKRLPISGIAALGHSRHLRRFSCDGLGPISKTRRIHLTRSATDLAFGQTVMGPRPCRSFLL